MDVQGWIEQAADALERGDLKRAVRLGEDLVEARHSYGFEVLARVQEQRGNLEGAIEVLEEGVGRAPRAWPLWLLLGELRSDNGDYDAALEAYDTAVSIDGVDLDELHINAAIVLHRAGRYEDSLARLERAPGVRDESVVAAARVRADILNILDRPDAAIAAAEAGLARVTDDIDDSEVAELYASIAKAALLKGDRREALRRAREALTLDPNEQTARWITGELE